jgi:hypothetical protein
MSVDEILEPPRHQGTKKAPRKDQERSYGLAPEFLGVLVVKGFSNV